MYKHPENLLHIHDMYHVMSVLSCTPLQVKCYQEMYTGLEQLKGELSL